MSKSDDINVEAVRQKLLDRSIVGLKKYGVTTERDDLSTLDWLNHWQQELLDASLYVEVLIQKWFSENNLIQQKSHLIDEIASMKSNVEFISKQRDSYKDAAEYNLRQQLKQAEMMRDQHFAVTEAKQQAIDDLERRLQTVFLMVEHVHGEDLEHKIGHVMHERIHAAAKITDLEEAVRTSLSRAEVAENAGIKLSQQVVDLKMAVDSLTEQLNTGLGIAPAGFLVATPNKPLRKFSKEHNAKAIAASAAKACGLAEIFTIYPHMKAVRGVEFKDAE